MTRPGDRARYAGGGTPAISLDGTRATMGIADEGAVVEILAGREVAAAGEAEIEVRWDGCRWLRTALRS